MKKISQELLERGFKVEHHHCSNDPGSLDGLVIPALKIALVDATAPHTIDPKYPGCIDEILNLGEYWDEQKITANKAAIVSCTKEISKRFQRAYRMLKAAKSVYDDWEAANGEAMDYIIANQKAAGLIERLFTGITTVGQGNNRKLFASALTPVGPVNYIESIVSGFSSRTIITGPPGTGKATLLEKVAATAITKGLDIESYYCPLDPLKIEHIIIPSLDVAITTSIPPHNQQNNSAATIIDMSDCLDKEIVSRLESVTDYDRTAFWEFFGKAGAYISEAKKLHDKLETYYIPNIHFSSVNSLRDKTLARILEYPISNDER